MEKMSALQQLEVAEEQKRKDEAGIKLAELEHKLRLEQARIAPQPPVTLTLEQAKAAGLTVMEPARTDLRHVPSRTDAHYDELGKLLWSLKSQLPALNQLRYVFGDHRERQDVLLAINHLEDALFRLGRIVEQRGDVKQSGC